MSDFANKLRKMYEKVVAVKGGKLGGGCGGARAGGARRRVVRRRKVVRGGSDLIGDGVSGGRRKVVRRKKVVGGAKKAAKTNPWIAHVKRYAKAHGVAYGVAMKKARASYRG